MYANKICLVQSFVASIRKFESVTDVDFKLYLYDIKSKWWKMNEAIRRPEQVSPKSSPRGSRSPAYPRGDSTGTLKTTISLGRIPSVIHSGPFYLVKDMGAGTHGTHTGTKYMF